jgi:hypothetical protein
MSSFNFNENNENIVLKSIDIKEESNNDINNSNTQIKNKSQNKEKVRFNVNLNKVNTKEEADNTTVCTINMTNFNKKEAYSLFHSLNDEEKINNNEINIFSGNPTQDNLIYELKKPSNERCAETIYELITEFSGFKNFMNYNGLDKSNIISCIPKLKLIKYNKGQNIFCQGDRSTVFYVIISGEVKLLSHQLIISQLEAKMAKKDSQVSNIK